MILDMSTRYLSDTGTVGCYDAWLPFHLSTPPDLFHFYGTDAMPFAYGNGDFHLFSKSLTLSPRLSPRPIYHKRQQVVVTSDDRARNLLTNDGLSLSDPRSSTFHRSASTADLQTEKRMQNSETNQIHLRRAPQSIHDLRAHATHSDLYVPNDQQRTTDSTASSHPQNWLRSPDDRTQYEQRRLRRKFHYKSYQDLHILSMYQENGSLLSLNSIRQPQSASIESASEASESTDNSPQSSPRPQTPADTHLIYRESWGEPTKIDEQRLRRLDARQVQVIEHDLEADESENEVKQATVLIGPGKPRLIQIYRPIRLCDAPDLHHHNNRSEEAEPSTPVHKNDVAASLFSSATTPGSCNTRFSDLSISTSIDEQLPIARRQFNENTIDDLGMDTTMGTSPSRKLSISSSSTILSLNAHVESYFADPFNDQWSPVSSTHSCNTSILEDGSLVPILPSIESERTNAATDQMTSQKLHQRNSHYQSLVSTITSTDKALDALAACDFDLTSPVLASFRSQHPFSKASNTTDYVLIARLNKIFSISSLSSLSVLAAWLVVDSHYSQLFSSAPAPLSSETTSSDDYTDEKENHSPPRSMNRKSTKLPHITISAATSPTFSIRPKSRNLISSPLYESNIPSKARSILGIPNSSSTPMKPRNNSQPTCSAKPDSPTSTTSISTLDSENPVHPSSTTLARAEAKARIVHASVQVVGRKLVADLLAEKDKPALGSGPHRGSRPSIRSRKKGSDPSDGAVIENDVAVAALWEACRCIASLEE